MSCGLEIIIQVQTEKNIIIISAQKKKIPIFQHELNAKIMVIILSIPV